MFSFSWKSGRGALCAAISLRTQPPNGLFSSFVKQSQAIIPIAFSFATTTRSSRLRWTTPLVSVTHFMLNPDGVNEFTDAVKKVNDGIKKTNFPSSGATRWYQLVNGGTGPHFVLVGDRANSASFQPPTDKTLDAMMEEAYGKEQGVAILSSLRKAIHSVYTEALEYRPDLSYVAPSK
jgi:hypothetical protein